MIFSTVRANGAVPYVVRRLLERSRTLLRRQLVAHAASWGTFQVASLLMHLGTVFALGIAAYLFVAGELTIGTVYLVFAYSESLRRPVEGITRHVQEFQQAAASTGRIRDLFAERSTILDGPGAPLPRGAPAVELDRVTFSYGDAVPVLRPPEAKGLEFDAVVVVEPEAIAGATARGLRLLYVALTRAVQELVVVHARPMPAGLAVPVTR